MEQKIPFNRHEIWVDYDLAPNYMTAVVKLGEQLNTEGKVGIKYYDHGNGATIVYYDPILNVTQHVGTVAQVEMGLIEPSDKDKEAIRSLITFENMPEDMKEIVDRVNNIIDILNNYPNIRYVMIGGAGYIMSTLVAGLKAHGYRPVHSFTKRLVREDIDSTGKVTKQSVFEHVGWVKDFVVD